MDDLVTRLRNESVINQALGIFDGQGDVSADAADEIERLVREVKIAKQKSERWRRVATQAFKMLDGHVEGCRRACMCTCGYEHMQPLLAEEERERNKNEKEN
jgi:hypothetical protein